MKLLVTALRDPASIRPIGLGKVNGRYFCFHTGVGYDAAVVRAVERRASLKRWAGHPLFIWAALKTWAVGYDRAAPHFSVRFPDGEVLDDGYFSIVLNTNPYTYLGNRPLDLSPAATFDRGLVAITFRTMRATSILAGLGGALRGGGGEDQRAPLGPHRPQRVRDRARHPRSPYQLDGDYLGETDELEFRHVPDAVRLVSGFSGPPG